MAAIAGAAVVSLQSRRIMPRTLQVPSDVIGYPTHANFNIDRYFNTYYAVVIVFPVLALIVYLALTWSARRLGLLANRHISSGAITRFVGTEVFSPATARVYAAQLMRAMMVGAVLGIEAGIAIARDPRGFLAVVAAAALGYTLVLVAIASSLHRMRPDSGPIVLRMASVNALAIPLVLVGMLTASGASKVVILSSGQVHQYPWLPVWLAALSALIATTVIAFALSRARNQGDVREVERRALVFVVGSIAVFLALAAMAGEVANFNVFEDGQGLVATRLFTDGSMPWRDFMAAHGLLDDVFEDLVGFKIFGSSVWGARAGIYMIIYPLYYVSLYLLFAFLFGRSWPFLLVSTLVMFSDFGSINARVGFWPLALVLLGALLVKPSVWRSAAFTLLTVAGAIVAPEAILLLLACGIMIVLYELTHVDRAKGAWANFPRTIGCAVGILALGSIFWLYLASQHALEHFLFYYKIASEVRLSGAVPFSQSLAITSHPRLDRLAAVSSPAALLMTFWYVVARLRNRRGFDTADWVMGADALLVLLYYPRFLSRADGHVYLPYALALPLLLYILWKFVVTAEMWIRDCDLGKKTRQVLTQHPVALALLVLVAIVFPARSALLDRLTHIPQHYVASVAREPLLNRLGYVSAESVSGDPHLYSDRDQVLSAYLRPGDRIFDFANEPGVNFYVLQYNPSTRYYIVNVQMARDAQADLLNGLKAMRPKIVIFDDAVIGVPFWDGIPNMVRHYDISQYILDNYRPLAIVHGEMLFADRKQILPDPTTLRLHLTEPLITKDIFFRSQQCDWGYEPNSFAVTPDRLGSRPIVNVVPREATSPAFPNPGLAPFEIALPPGASWTDFQWIEIDTSSHFHADTMVLYDTDKTTLQRQIRFKTLDDSPRKYLIRVGSCAQWHGYAERIILLGHTKPQDISAIRLIP